MTLRWASPLFTAEEARAADRFAIDLGIGDAVLMEQAGAGAAVAIRGRFPDARRVAVLAGKGANGGDGFVIARRLADAGIDVEVECPMGQPEADSTAGRQATIWRELGGRVVEQFGDADVVVEALLGTGSAGAPRGPVAAAVWRIAQAAERGAAVVAVDVPTGVDASSGEVAGQAVRADLTVTFHGTKIGHLVGPGAQQCGEVVVVDIGIPGAAPAPTAQAGGAFAVTAGILGEIPRKGAGDHKYRAGAVAVHAGGGANALACLAALRAGGGYVMCTGDPHEVVEAVRIDATASALLESRAGAFVAGMALPEDEATAVVVEALVGDGRPVVLDAGALAAYRGRLDRLAGAAGRVVITPHEGEAAQLLGGGAKDVAAQRVNAARELAQRSGQVAVLKGAGTIVARPDGAIFVDTVATPSLATLGTGDVLSGAIGALLAKGMEPEVAAAAAVHLEGRAARLAAAELGPEGIIASDIAQRLSRAREAG